jgi:hypothetical protein
MAVSEEEAKAIGEFYAAVDRLKSLQIVRSDVCVRPSHLPDPAKPGHGVHLNLSGHQF